MRFTGFFIALLFIAAAARAETTASMCEYSHPQHPGWDYFRSCAVTVTEAAGKRSTRAEVENGSSFTVEVVTGADGDQITVNGRPATRLVRDGAECYSTKAAQETICIHPAGTEAPVAPVAPTSSLAGLDMTPGIGGGEEGFCLLTSRNDGQVQLTDHGACARAENCQVEADTGAQSCLTLYVWKNGRENGLYRTSGWLALDGAEVSETAPGCWGDETTGFCFATRDWTEAEQPVLAGPLPPGPGTPAAQAATPTTPPAPAETAAETLPPSPAEAGVKGLCRFLKDGQSIATQPCQQTQTCVDDSCDVGFNLATGLSVHLQVVSNQVLAIDGHTTGPVPMPSTGTICVPYLASPFIFCFAPT